MKVLSLRNIHEWPLTTRLLIVSLIGAIAFYVGYRLDLASLRTELVNTEEKEKDLKQQLQQTVIKELKLKQDTDQLPGAQNLLVDWQKKLANKENLPGLLNEILKAGGNNQIYFSVFNPDEPVKEGLYEKVPIKLVAVGTYHQLAHFISDVANMNWIVVIGDFNISNENRNDKLGAQLAAQAATQNLLTMEMTFFVYHLPDKKALEEYFKKKATEAKDKAEKDKKPETPPPGAKKNG